MDGDSREALHRRVARRTHGEANRDVTVEGLEELREAALNARPLSRRRKAAETYTALTGAKP